MWMQVVLDPPGVGNRVGLTAIHLTLPTTHAALGLTRVHIHPHVYDPSKKNTTLHT
jgi:hypothetical protein